MSNCSLRVEYINLIKNASKIFLFLMYSGAPVSTFHLNWRSGKYFKCLAGAKCCFEPSPAAHLKTTFVTDSQTKFSLRPITFVNNAAVIFNINFNLREWSNTFSVTNNIDFTFIICKYNKLCYQAFVSFSFDSGSGNRRIISYRSSNDHSGII